MSVDPLARAPRGTRPHAARLLVEIPWRQAGLIALCVLAGAAATLMPSALRPSPRYGVRAIAQSQRPHAAPVGDAVRLHMDVEPELELAYTPADAASAVASTPSPGAVLRIDDERSLDALLATLEAMPPAAGPAPMVATGEPFAAAGPAWRGPVGGLLLGLLLAGLRELRGGRMRTAREAQWALGVPVLGTIPTLSARARAASIGRAQQAADGAAATA